MNNKVLTIENLYKSINDQVILKNINFELNFGDRLVVLGPSGCGKSTLLRCINGLENIDQGVIQFKEKNLNQANTDWNLVRQEIGMVFQNYELFPNLNVIDNILLGPLKVQKRNKAEAEAEADLLLERVGLLDKKHAYPRELSGGQKQRIAIVRALSMHPSLMLFDEVTASLDPEMVREVLEVILELADKNMTMIIVTHELNFAKKIANKVIFMEQGEIISTNTNVSAFFDNQENKRIQQFLSIFDY